MIDKYREHMILTYVDNRDIKTLIEILNTEELGKEILRKILSKLDQYIIHIDDPSNTTSYDKYDLEKLVIMLIELVDIYDNKLGESTLMLSLYISELTLKAVLEVISDQKVLIYINRLDSLGDELNIRKKDLILRYVNSEILRKYNKEKKRNNFKL